MGVAGVVGRVSGLIDFFLGAVGWVEGWVHGLVLQKRCGNEVQQKKVHSWAKMISHTTS